MTWFHPLLFSVGLIFALSSLTANLLVVFALTYKKRTRLPAFNILILGHGVISLVDTCCNIPLLTTAAYLNHWPLANEFGGTHLCRFHSFFNSVIPTTRIVLIALMALDRMVAVFSPINYPDRVTRERAWCMFIYCWLHSSAVYISMLAGATPISYRKDHYSCLISSNAPESYIIVMVSFGYVIPVIFASIFLMMILKKYIAQEPAISVIEDPNSNQGVTRDISIENRTFPRKRLKNKSSYRSLTDFEVAGYVSILFLLWLICQSPLFVTLTSDMILSKDAAALNGSKVVTNLTVTSHDKATRVNSNATKLIYLNATLNSSAYFMDADVDSYQQMFPREFQTIVQFLNIFPSLVYPILTFVLYRSVWSRLKHVVGKSRFAKRHHRALSIIDEDIMSSGTETNSRSRHILQHHFTNRTRQRTRRRSRLTIDLTNNLPETSVASSAISDEHIENNGDEQRRMETPVLLATSDGLLLHQVIRQSAADICSDSSELKCVVDENGFLGTISANTESDFDGCNDAMTSSCNSTKPLIDSGDVMRMETIAGSTVTLSPNSNISFGPNLEVVNDSGIEDSPTSRPKVEAPIESLVSVESQVNNQSALISSASCIRPVLSSADPLRHLSGHQSNSVFPATTSTPLAQNNSQTGERIRYGVNSTVRDIRRMLGNASPKIKYQATPNVFTVSAEAREPEEIDNADRISSKDVTHGAPRHDKARVQQLSLNKTGSINAGAFSGPTSSQVCPESSFNFNADYLESQKY